MEIEKLYNLFLACHGVCTDTRKIQANSLFFSLKGGNFNGNEFAAQALEKGAKYAVVDEAKYCLSANYILVANALKTLQSLAAYHTEGNATFLLLPL
jgi:UDP-N-acetylmuramoyl-tripeptide--D-alanyl-D-alanine ligase